jgi:hypothetical protein
LLQIPRSLYRETVPVGPAKQSEAEQFRTGSPNLVAREECRSG